MDRSGINYLTQEEFNQLDITAIDQILNSIHFHRSRLDGQEVFAIQARAVLTHGRNRPPEPAPRPQPDNNLDEGCDNNPTADGPDDPQPHDSRRSGDLGPDGPSAGSDTESNDPGAARSKRELRDAEHRASRLADYPEIADALAAGQISTEQADLISKARISTRTKLELLADAKHEHADHTAQAVKTAVKTAVIEADSESADDRFARQRKNRRGVRNV